MKSFTKTQTLDTPINLAESVREYERFLITLALEKCNGVQTHTAKHLGTTRRILRYRMDKLEIQPRHGKQP